MPRRPRALIALSCFALSWFVLSWWSLWAAPPAAAATPRESAQAALCERAIVKAARRHGTPESLLRALSHVESGRTLGGARRPWPWTVNAAGEGRWFDSRAEALAFIRAKRRAGVRSIDVGCLQLNMIWHAQAFSSVAEMLDPEANADYAARYLADLKLETGDWMRAAGYYHSRTPKHFNRYSKLVRIAYASLKERAADLAAPALAPSPLRESRERARPAFQPVWRGLLRQATALRLGREAAPLFIEAAHRPLAGAAAERQDAPAKAPKAITQNGRRGHGGLALHFGGAAAPLVRGDGPGLF